MKAIYRVPNKGENLHGRTTHSSCRVAFCSICGECLGEYEFKAPFICKCGVWKYNLEEHELVKKEDELDYIKKVALEYLGMSEVVWGKSS